MSFGTALASIWRLGGRNHLDGSENHPEPSAHFSIVFASTWAFDDRNHLGTIRNHPGFCLRSARTWRNHPEPSARQSVLFLGTWAEPSGTILVSAYVLLAPGVQKTSLKKVVVREALNCLEHCTVLEVMRGPP